MLLDQKNVYLMYIGKERGWVKEAYSIVLMQMHANVPAKQHRVRASPGKETN